MGVGGWGGGGFPLSVPISVDIRIAFFFFSSLRGGGERKVFFCQKTRSRLKERKSILFFFLPPLSFSPLPPRLPTALFSFSSRRLANVALHGSHGALARLGRGRERERETRKSNIEKNKTDTMEKDAFDRHAHPFPLLLSPPTNRTRTSSSPT